MEMINLLEEHPKTTIVIKQWLLDVLLSSIEDSKVPDDFKEFARQQSMETEHVAGMLQNTPRSMFDVFDNQELYIQITGDNKHGWSWEVDGSVENAVCSSRKEAETAAVIESFKLLEAKI